MNKKIKKEMKRLEKKRRNERLMAMAIAGGILVSATPSDIVKADNIDSEVELNVLAVSEPAIDFGYIQYFEYKPRALALYVSDFGGNTLEYLTIDGNKVPGQYVEVDGMYIRISQDYMETLRFAHRQEFKISGKFSNGKTYDMANVIYFADPDDHPDFPNGGGNNGNDVVAIPTIEAQEFYYIKSLGNGATIRGVEAKNVDVESVSFGEYTFHSSDVSLNSEDGYILLQPYAFRALNVKNGTYSVSVIFSDGTVVNSGLTLHVSDYEGSPDDTPEENGIPTFKYNKLNPSNIVLPNDEYFDKEIDTVYLQGCFFPITGADSDLIKVVDGHVVLTPAALEAVGVDSKLYNYTVEYEDYTVSAHSFNLEVVEESEIVPPVEDDNITIPPTDNDNNDSEIVAPPSEDNNPGDDVPEIAPPSEDEDNKPGGDEIEVAPPEIDDDNTEDDAIINPPVEEDKPSEDNKPGNEDKPSDEDNTTPPSEDIKDEVVFDKNNPKDLVIPGLEIGDELIDFVVINGEEFDVEYKTSLAREISKPSVYIVDGKLVVPVAVLEYLGLDSESLDITVNLANGKVLNKVVTLNVVDSSDKEEDKEDVIVPPVTDEDGDSSDKDETDKDDSNSGIINGSQNNGSSNVTTNGSQNNQTSKPSGTVSTNGSSSNTNSANENVQTQLPNTGAPVSAGLIGGIITTVGAFLSRKRK